MSTFTTHTRFGLLSGSHNYYCRIVRVRVRVRVRLQPLYHNCMQNSIHAV